MHWRIWIIVGVVIMFGAGAAAWQWRTPIASQVESITAQVTGKSSFRFAVVGDTHGVNPIYEQIVRDIRTEDFAFLLHLADTSENGTEAEFRAVHALEQSLSFPVYHTVGNHDIKADASRDVFKTVFDQPAWGVWDLGAVRLIILDNANRKIGFTQDQLDWLSDILIQPFSGVTVLAYHRPFGLPLEAYFGDDETAASRITNQRLVEILTATPVDMILTGHVHTWLEYTVAGIPAIVSGGGGDPAQTLLGGPTNNFFHYLDIKVDGTDLTPIVRRIELTE